MQNLKIGQSVRLKINEAMAIQATIVNILDGGRLDVQIHEQWEVFDKDDIVTVDESDVYE